MNVHTRGTAQRHEHIHTQIIIIDKKKIEIGVETKSLTRKRLYRSGGNPICSPRLQCPLGIEAIKGTSLPGLAQPRAKQGQYPQDNKVVQS